MSPCFPVLCSCSPQIRRLFLFSGYYGVLNELSFFDQKMYENRFQTQTNSNVHKKHNAIYNDST